MLFKFVSLENFGCIERFEKTLKKGILILSGDNGNGKSTVMKAILLTVFDTYDGVLLDYVRWGSKFFKATVEFSHKGVDYSSTVMFGEGVSDRTLVSTPGTSYKGDEAKKRLKTIFDTDLLKAAMLALEQQIDIVTTKPAERRDYLKRIYDIEFKQQLLTLEADIRETELFLAGRTARKTDLVNKTYTVPVRPEFPFEEIDYVTYRRELSSLQEEKARLRVIVASSASAELACDCLEKELSDTERDLVGVSEEIDLINSKIQRLPEEKEKEQTQLDRRLEDLLSELDTRDMKNKETLRSLEEVKAGIRLLRLGTFDTVAAENVSKELAVIQSRLSELKSAKDVCPTCGQSTNTPEQVERRKIEIVSLEAQKNVLDKTVAAIKVKKEEYDKQFEETEVNRKRLSDIEHSIEIEKSTFEGLCREHALKKESILREKETIDTKFFDKKNHLDELLTSTLKNEANTKTTITSIKTQLEEKQQLINGAASEKLSEVERTVQELQNRIRSYEDSESRLREVIAMEEVVQVQREADSKELTVLSEEMQGACKRIGDYKEEVKILKTEFPIYIISRVVKDLEKNMNDFFKRTYGGRYVVEVIDRKNALHVVYGPKKQDVSLASGYEKQVMNYAFKSAISKAIGSRCMLLDEVDSASSIKNSLLFYQVIGNSLGIFLDQIILISHKDVIKDMLESDFGADVITFVNGTPE